MPQYALLILPSANRVYADASVALTQAELAVFSRAVLGGRLTGAEAATIGGVPYVTFTASSLAGRDAAFLANLSCAYALFEVAGDLLRPVGLHPLDRYDDDLVTIQKYAGKTNDQFTKLLLNVTLLSSAFAGEMLDRRLSVLDPLCGRGTTLNHALMLGYDAAGIDIDARDFEAYATFIKTWLKRKRLKHQVEYDAPVRREGKVAGRRLQVRLAATKEDFKAGDTQRLDVVNADTTRSPEFFQPGTFDLIVADAPYGVQHGSQAGGGLARGPLGLLAAAAPAWARLLRDGGAVGISWNTHVASRDDAVKTLADAGLQALDDGPYLSFRHRVDQAITRDIVIARKPLG
ncbi:MAG TPA: SAM-dependent methyltransferase [Trebonia sp.]|jgi:SAM-dependent methyltransferase|nr:SAM-dependent methyltransferase [Trebonia sp.]